MRIPRVQLAALIALTVAIALVALIVVRDTTTEPSALEARFVVPVGDDATFLADGWVRYTNSRVCYSFLHPSDYLVRSNPRETPAEIAPDIYIMDKATQSFPLTVSWSFPIAVTSTYAFAAADRTWDLQTGGFDDLSELREAVVAGIPGWTYTLRRTGSDTTERKLFLRLRQGPKESEYLALLMLDTTSSTLGVLSTLRILPGCSPA